MVELFGKINVDWLGKRKLFFAITTFLVLIGGLSLLAKGHFRYGVDFKGGTILRVAFKEPTDIGKVREAIPNAEIQSLLTGQNEFLIEYQGAGDTAVDASRGREEVTQALDKAFPGKFEIRSAQSVGPKVGQDLRRQAVMATLYALGGILVYIAFRFEWIYGVAAVLAVFHDVLVTLGIFALFQWEISLTVIAALLTLIGYSMNDTIVIFDRIRENTRLRRRDSLVQLANDAINQTLSRTVITSGLTFVSVVAIVLFGGEVLRGFALALTIGILVGCYSTIAVASPVMLWWEYMTGGKKGHGRAAGQKPRAAEQTLAKV